MLMTKDNDRPGVVLSLGHSVPILTGQHKFSVPILNGQHRFSVPILNGQHRFSVPILNGKHRFSVPILNGRHRFSVPILNGKHRFSVPILNVQNKLRKMRVTIIDKTPLTERQHFDCWTNFAVTMISASYKILSSGLARIPWTQIDKFA